MAIDATTKGPAANSYVDVAAADAYFADRPNSTVWSSLPDNATKEKYLKWAAKMLDNRVVWPGNKTTTLQSMMWPRTSVRDRFGWSFIFVYLDPDVLPQFLKDAQCEQALFLISNDPTLESDKRGIKSVGVDTIQVEFDKHEPDLTICRAAREIISEFGEFPGNKPLATRLVRV
jgi:hypothetical protein